MIRYFTFSNGWIVKDCGDGTSMSFPDDTSDVSLMNEFEEWKNNGNVPEKMFLPHEAIEIAAKDE